MEHVDWFAHRWAHGTANLNMEQAAVYFEIINRTYLLGDFPPEDYAGVAGRFRTQTRKIRRLIGELIALGKIRREEGEHGAYWVANGCSGELDRVEERIETARRNGRRRRRATPEQGPSNETTPSSHRRSTGTQNGKLDLDIEENQTSNDPSRIVTRQDNTINPLSPFQTVDEEGQPSPTSEAPKPEAPASAEHPADPEREAPGEPLPAAPEPPVTRASPRSHGTNPRARGTNPRALGLNPRSLAQGPPPLPVALPDAPEPVPRMFEAVLREFGEAAYRSWLVPLEVRSVNGAVVLAAKSPFDRDWIERRYGDAMRRVAGMPVQIIAGSS